MRCSKTTRISILSATWLLTTAAASLAEGSLLKTAEGSSLKAAEGSLLNAAEGSSLKAAEGSSLKAAEGSLLQAAEGSSLKAAEGSLSKAAEGSLPKAAEGSSSLVLKGVWLNENNYTLSRYQRVGGKGIHGGVDVRLGAPVRARGQPASNDWSLALLNLGLPANAARFTLDTRDALALDLSYREITQQLNNSGLSPFQGVEQLVLSDNWIAGSHSDSFDQGLINQPLNRALVRRKLQLEVSQRINAVWQMTSQIELEKQTGHRLNGMAIYTNAANPHGVLLPKPVDQQTHHFALSSLYNDGTTAASLGYHFTGFNNHFRALTWQNPFLSGLGTALDYPAGVGSYVSAPDYSTHQWLASAGHQLTNRIRLTLDGSVASTRQDENLIPLEEIDGRQADIDQPVDRLDGALRINTLRLAVLTQPLRRLAVNFRYGFKQRKNSFQRYAWPSIWGARNDTSDTDLRINNRPLDLEQDTYRLDANWRLKNRTRIQLRYDYLRTARNFAAVSLTREDRYALTVYLPGSVRLKHRLSLTMNDLAGSTYEWSRGFFQDFSTDLINQTPANQRWTNHPLLRQYSLSNQEKSGIQWLTTYQPDSAWTLQLKGETDWVNFDKSELGLTDVRDAHFNFSASYRHSSRLNSWGWVDYRASQRRQTGRDFLGGINKPANVSLPPYPQGSDPSRNYQTDQDNTATVVGAGLDWQFNQRLAVSSSYSWLHGREIFDIQANGARDLNGENLPNIETQLHSLDSQLRFKSSERLSLTLQHQYLRFADNNWQWQNVSLDAMRQVLGSGQRNPNDVIHQLTFSLQYRF
ncbi:MtrB/PioB family outer membrane beta-barrel protein [Pseudomonadales bacterium]|nr:MtrB/PioB family outer membrane beta-barrel protein [Pseudomonadales bacterium]